MSPAEWTSEAELLDLVHESIFARDRDLRITFWNAAAKELYGWSRDEAIGRDAEELLRCVHPVPLAAREEMLFATGRWQGELVRRTRSGESVFVEVTWTVRRDEDGEPIEVVETGRDITKERKAEQATRLSEYRFRNLFEAMAVAFWEVDFTEVGGMLKALRDQGVTDLRAYMLEHRDFVRAAMERSIARDVNTKGLELFGAQSKEEVIGLGTGRFWPAESEAVYIESLVATMEKRPHYVTETRLLTLQGQPIDVLFTVAWSPETRQSGLVLVGFIDISDRAQAFEALERSELKYRNLFQHMPISLWQIDTSKLTPALAGLRAEGVTDLDAYMDANPHFLGDMLQLVNVDQVNEQTIKMFGGTSSEDFAGPIARFWQDSPGTMRRSLAARFAGAESYAEETKVRALDGRTVDVFYTSAFPDALRELGIGLVGAIDIGDRLEAERMLQQVQADFAHAARIATLGELTASIAHEVNQPLAAIAANGEASLRWLDRPEPNVSEARELATRMVSDARRAADVIAHIRGMATRKSPGRERLSINEVVADTIDFLQRDLQTKEVRVEFAAAPNLPPIEADATQIQQVLVNLAVNAEQAMAQHDVANRHLTIRTGADGNGAVMVEVEDSGPGIPPDKATHLFDSFFTTKADGLGIGLSICRSIIEAHGGRIEAANTGHGACFFFTLPAAEQAHEVRNMPSRAHTLR